jgi:hypothetical protein
VGFEHLLCERVLRRRRGRAACQSFKGLNATLTPHEIRATSLGSPRGLDMILRQILRPLKTNCCSFIRTNGQGQLRYTSVSAQIRRPHPKKPSRTDYLEKYQEKLERKAKEYTCVNAPLMSQGGCLKYLGVTRALPAQN